MLLLLTVVVQRCFSPNYALARCCFTTMTSSSGGPYLVVNAANHEAYIVLAAVICMTWTILTIIIRLYLRLRLNGPFGFDDATASLGTVSQRFSTVL